VKVHWLVFPTLLGEEYTQVPVLGVPVVVSALAGKLAISSLKVTEYWIELPIWVPTTLVIVGATVSRITVRLSGACGPGVAAKSFTELAASVRVLVPSALQVIWTL
jgi:hypothetical protein